MKRKRFINVAAAVIMVFSIVLIPSSTALGDAHVDTDMSFFTELISFVEDNYAGDITREELLEGAYKGLFSTLDSYSHYYSPEEFQSMMESTTGQFGGVGMEVIEKDGYITVVTPFEGSPAYKAGIKPGDRIVSVDDIDITGVTSSQAVQLIKGEPGTTVKLGIMRDGENGIIIMEMIREEIKINPISYETINEDTGYIKITTFNSNTFANILKPLREYNDENIDKLIIDLRNNPGGYLDEVLEVLNLFVPKGTVLNIKHADDRMKTYHSTVDFEPKYELVVLVNEGSASASEIFAGAIQDNEVGTIVGTTTFGKGLVQSLYPIINGSGIKLTTAQYFTPNMNKVQGEGITPDILIENIPDKPKVDRSKIPTLDKEREAGLGIVGLDVLGAEEILKLLGYEIENPDGILDEGTFEAIKAFQSHKGLKIWGKLDFPTQDALTQALTIYAQPEVIDEQLEKALEILSSDEGIRE